MNTTKQTGTFVAEMYQKNQVKPVELVVEGDIYHVAKVIATWAHETMQLKAKLRAKGWGYKTDLAKCKATELNIYLIGDEDMKVNFVIPNFGGKILERGIEATSEAVGLIADTELRLIEYLKNARAVREYPVKPEPAEAPKVDENKPRIRRKKKA